MTPYAPDHRCLYVDQSCHQVDHNCHQVDFHCLHVGHHCYQIHPHCHHVDHQCHHVDHHCHHVDHLIQPPPVGELGGQLADDQPEEDEQHPGHLGVMTWGGFESEDKNRKS